MSLKVSLNKINRIRTEISNRGKENFFDDCRNNGFEATRTLARISRKQIQRLTPPFPFFFSLWKNVGQSRAVNDPDRFRPELFIRVSYRIEGDSRDTNGSRCDQPIDLQKRFRETPCFLRVCVCVCGYIRGERQRDKKRERGAFRIPNLVGGEAFRLID